MKFKSAEDERAFVSSITCNICLETYSSEVKPTVIMCGHSLCIECVKGIASAETKTVLCPMCRVKSPIHLENIAPSFELLNMATLYTDSKNASTQPEPTPQTKTPAIIVPPKPQPSAPPKPASVPIQEVRLLPKVAVSFKAEEVQKHQAPTVHIIKCVKTYKSEKYGFVFKELGHGRFTISVEDGSIAEASGLLDNDFVLEINGKKANGSGLKLKDVVKMVQKHSMEVEMVVSSLYKNTTTNELVYCIVEPSAKAKAAGYTLTAQKGRLYVSEITSNSPAYYGGMRKNDEIIEVNEIDVTNKDFDEVKSLLKWDGESTFVIGVRRSKK